MNLESSTDNGTDRIVWCWLGLKSVELWSLSRLAGWTLPQSPLLSLTHGVTHRAQFGRVLARRRVGGWQQNQLYEVTVVLRQLGSGDWGRVRASWPGSDR